MTICEFNVSWNDFKAIFGLESLFLKFFFLIILNFQISNRFYIVNNFLPEFKLTRLNFLQKILQDEKQVLTCDMAVKRELQNSYEEYAVKNCWPLVKSDTNFRSYMPTDDMDNGRYVDREFFWGVAFYVIPSWAPSYQKKSNKIA